MYNPGRARRYKSRKTRPCDLCRGRKTACRMEIGPPCQLCYDRQRPCTFLQAPSKRSRPNRNLPREASDFSRKDAGGRLAPGDVFLEHALQMTSSDCSQTPERVDISITGRSEPDCLGDLVNTESLHQAQNIILTFDIPEVKRRVLNDKGLDSTANAHAISLECAPFQENDKTPISPPATNEPWSSQGQNTDSYARSNPNVSILTSKDASVLAASSFAGSSLDASPTTSYRLVGPTGDLDPYILNHRIYDAQDGYSALYDGLRYREMCHTSHTSSVSDVIRIPDCPAIFTVRTDTAISSSTLLSDAFESATKEFRNRIKPESVFRLSVLYARYIHPHFPILSARQLPSDPDEASSMPLALICAICGLAIPFIIYDDVLSLSLPLFSSPSTMFRLTWEVLCQEFETPRLSTIQSCLLLLQASSTKECIFGPPFWPALLNITVALCHSLGLHRDCSLWVNMPLWERRLRKRIWWGVWVMEKWTILGESVPSILSKENYDVQHLHQSDLEDDWSEYIEPLDTSTHFPHLVTLTEILCQVVSAFFTVRATVKTATDIKRSLEIAKPLRAMLKEWHEGLPLNLKRRTSHSKSGHRDSNGENSRSLGVCDLDAYGTFYLAYLTVQLTLFRALLRPVAHMSLHSPPSSSGNVDELGTGDSYKSTAGISAIIQGAMVLIKEVVSFVESLEESDWVGFWHSWSRTNFAIVSCVMLNLLAILRPPVLTQSHVSLSSNHETQQWTDETNGDRRVNWDTSSLPNVEGDYIALLEYLNRWHRAMKVASCGGGGRHGLVNLSLLRMEALLAELHQSAAVN